MLHLRFVAGPCRDCRTISERRAGSIGGLWKSRRSIVAFPGRVKRKLAPGPLLTDLPDLAARGKAMRHALAAAGPVAIVLALAAPATASEPRAFRADYSITLLGLPVAKARFDSRFDGDRFRISGSLSSSGVARIFDDTKGTTSVEGTIRGDAVRPAAFAADYVSGRKKSSTAIRFSGDAVESVVSKPRKKRNPKSWVAVNDAHLKAVLDPLSSSIIPATSAQEVCTRTIRFFDGEMRADLKLSPNGEAKDGRVTCTARFVPVAGYRKDRKQIDYLRNQSRITVTFAPLADTGLYTPVDASVGTQIGTLRIVATNIEAR